MKRKFLKIAFVFPLFFNIIQAQKVTFDITGGYNVPLARQTEAKKEYVQSSSTIPYFYNTSATVRLVSYGHGGNVAVNLNWFSKKNIGFGIKLNALIGTPFQHVATIAYPGYEEYYDILSQSYSIQFIPHLCFRYDFKKVSPVLEAGMILGATFIDHKNTITASNQTETILTKVRDYGNVMLGFYSSLGISCNVSKLVKINVALTCTAASYAPAHWKRKTFTVDGVDRMGSLYLSQIQGDYVSERDIQATRPANVPSQSLKSAIAFSGVGFNTGISFLFGGKKKKKEPQKQEEIRF